MRARLAVLSECAGDWQAAVRHWIEAHAALKRPGPVATQPMPSIADEVMLYQTIVGAWPMTLCAGDAAGVAAFAERLAAWQEKSLREAKLQTDWVAPNAAYEDAARGFLAALLAPGSRFLAEASMFVRRIAPAGAVNGLAQTLLKLTAPGVPDFFQGTEFWDLSLVDPDNRRPVDFAARAAALREGGLGEGALGEGAPGEGASGEGALGEGASPVALAGAWRDGRVKQAVIARGLALRRRAPALFARGDYRPLEVRGRFASHAVAFLRVLGRRRVPDGGAKAGLGAAGGRRHDRLCRRRVGRHRAGAAGRRFPAGTARCAGRRCVGR